MEPILTALLLTLVAGAATGLGGALILFKKKLSSNFLAGALGLSAGVMIFISLAELYPEAQEAIVQTWDNGRAAVVLAFFVGMGIITLIKEYDFKGKGGNAGEATQAGLLMELVARILGA